MADRNLVLQLLIAARDNASAAIDRVGDGVRSMGSAVSQTLAPLRSFGTLLAAAAGLGGAKELLDRAEAYTRLTNQLRVATKGEEEYQAALAAVVEVARRSNADLDSTASLYGKIAQNAEALGLSQDQVADVTETVAKAMQLSGAEAGAASGAILQLGQALGSGALRGDEFNSIMEASPKLMEALAAGLGVAAGELRAMAEAGQLTADRVVNALLTQKTAIDEVYGKLPQTVGQAMTGLANAGTLFVGKLNEQTGATQGLVSGLKFLAENLDAVAALMGAAFAASVARGTVALGQQVVAIQAAKAAARDQAIASAAQQEAALAAARGQLAAAQAAANRALAEQRLKLQIVALMEAELGYGAVAANLTAARQAAAVAAQNATAATQRYAAAQAALVAAQGAGTASVGLFARAMGFLTGPGGLILLAVSAFAGLYAAFSRQKPATDALTASTDQYRESLENLNSAQLRVNLQQLNDSIGEQEKVVAEAEAAVEKLKTGHRNLYEVLRDGRPLAVQVTEAEGALADARAKLAQQQEKLLATNERLSEAWEKETTTNAELLGQYARQATTMDKLSVAIQNRAKHLKTVSDAQSAETEALLAKAEAEGKVNDVDRLTVQLAAQRATAARTAAELARGEATAAGVKVAALEGVETVRNRLTPKEAEALEVAREAAVVKNAEASAAEALAARLDAAAKSMASGTEATQRLTERAAALREETERGIEASDRENTVRQAQLAAAIASAEAKGNEAEAARLNADAAREEVAAAEERIQQLIAQQAQIERHINLIYEQANADGVYTAAERAIVEALEDKALEIGKEIDLVETKLPLQEREARQAEIMAGPIGELTRLYAEQTAEHERAAAASERYYDTQIAQKDAAIDVAQAKGDEAEAASLLLEKQDLEIEKADALSAAKAQAALDARNAVEVKKLEAAASDGVSTAEQKEIDALQEVADAKQAAAAQAAIHAAALRDEKKAVEDSSDVFDNASKNAYKFSDAAADVAKRNAEVGKSADDAAKKTEALSSSYIKFNNEVANAVGLAGIGKFNELFAQVKNSIEQANLQAQRLAADGIRAAGANAEELARSLLGVKGALSDAARTAGEHLLDALQSAREEARGLAEDMAAMAADFEKEILQIQGKQSELEELNYREKLAKLEELRVRAGQLGEEEYQEARRRLLELHELKLKKLDEESKKNEDVSSRSANSVANAWKGASREIEAAASAARSLSEVDLSGLVKRSEELNKNFQELAGIL